MKFSKKSILSTSLAVSLAAATVIGGTYAYLQDSTEDVINSFNTNNVKVELTETPADYNIIPGTSQEKDPTVTVSSTIPAYVFVEVDDDTVGLVTYEIADGWIELNGFPGVYYRTVEGSEEKQSFEVLKGSTVYYDKALGNSDMLDDAGILMDDVQLTFKAHIIQRDGFESGTTASARSKSVRADVPEKYNYTGPVAAYLAVAGVNVNDKAGLAEALANPEDGAVIILPEEPIVLEKEESLSFKEDTTVVGGTITNGTVYAADGSDVTFNGVTFTEPTNKTNNATSVYAHNYSSKIVFEGCTFKDLQWEAIQITAVAGAEIIVNNCYFSNSKTMAESGIDQNRYFHIELPKGSTTDISKIKATITNNVFENVVQSAFGGSGYFKDSAVTVYGVPHSNITLSGNVFCGVVAEDALNNPNYIWISDGRTSMLRYDGFSVAEKAASDEDAKQALESGKPVVLADDVNLEVGTIINAEAPDIYLNGKTLTITGNQYLEPKNGQTLSLKNGTVKMENTSHISISAAEGSTVRLENVEMDMGGKSMLIDSGINSARIDVIDSKIVTTDYYAISTNASNPESGEGVVINIINSEITVDDPANHDCTAVLMNVPGTLNIEDSTLTAGRQAVIVRTGTANIKNSTLVNTLEYTPESNWAKYDNAGWGSGNEVPVAVLVVGDRSTAYPWNASCTLENVTLLYGKQTERKPVYAAAYDGQTTVINGISETEVTVSADNNGVTVNP